MEMPTLCQETPVAQVRRLLAGLRDGDVEAILEVCDPDILLDHVGDPLHLPFAGRYQGHAGVHDYLRRLDTAAEYLTFEPVEMVPASQCLVLVVGREHLRFRMTGLDSVGRWVQVFDFAGGCIAGLTIWSDGAAQLLAYRGF